MCNIPNTIPNVDHLESYRLHSQGVNYIFDTLFAVSSPKRTFFSSLSQLSELGQQQPLSQDLQLLISSSALQFTPSTHLPANRIIFPTPASHLPNQEKDTCAAKLPVPGNSSILGNPSEPESLAPSSMINNLDMINVD